MPNKTSKRHIRIIVKANRGVTKVMGYLIVALLFVTTDGEVWAVMGDGIFAQRSASK